MLEGEERLKTICLMAAIVYAGNCVLAGIEGSKVDIGEAADEAKVLMALVEESAGYSGK